MAGNYNLAEVPKSEKIPSLLAELARIIAEQERENGGRYFWQYSRGRWLEVSFWTGNEKMQILNMDTRITEAAIEAAIKSVRLIGEGKINEAQTYVPA